MTLPLAFEQRGHAKPLGDALVRRGERHRITP
jgi:hypothetical protein